MNKTILYQLLALLLLFGISTTSNAQVTIGSSKKPEAFSVLELDNKTKTDKGGLRLPHLSTAERIVLSSQQTFIDEQHREDGAASLEAGLALGLTIYNTDTNCIEYWDGYKWVSLCLGSASIEVSNYPQTNPIPPGGGETDPMTPSENPKCASNPPYSIAVAVGAAYTNAYIIEQSTGEFKVYMQENATAKDRTAIVRLTNNCTGEYKEFVFNQEGNISLCDGLAASDKPVLTASNGGVICGEMGNSIILGVTNPAFKADGTTPATYIWMRNDNEEIGRGKSITVSQEGRYKVYAGGISCGDNDFSEPILVTVNKTGTPPSEITIMADNGTIVCGGTAVNLTVKDFSAVTGTVLWYKDGVKLAQDGQQTISTTTGGNFVAVVSQGGCTSNSSNAIAIKVQAGTPVVFSKADIEINSKSLNLGDPSFCSGGWLNMKIVTPQTGYVYKWIVNGVQVGSGETSNYQLPGSANTDINLSIIAESGAAGSCPTAITIASTMSVNEPLNAAITGSKIFCNNVPGGAQLNTTPGGTIYTWKNITTGRTYATGASNSLGATVGGRYEVEIITTEGCKSVTPSPHEIEMIGSPALTWTGGVLASIVGENEKVTFVVKNAGSPVTQGYTWTAANKSGSANATIPAGTIGETAEITFTGGGEVTLTIVGKGYCGNSAPLLVDVTVNQNKPDKPLIVPPTASPVCGGWLFTIEEGSVGTLGTLKDYEDKYGPDFTITWTLVSGVGNSTGVGTPVPSGANGRFCYVPFTLASGSKAVMKATCTADGRLSDPSDQKSASGGIGAVQSYSLKGQTCFDVKQTNYTNNDCGVWAQREAANFNIMHEYELLGTLLPTNASDLTWSLEDPNNLIESENYTTVNKAKLKIRDVSQHSSIKGSTTGLSFTLHVSFTVNNGGCSATYSKSIEINLRDCDCCGSVADNEGNIYTAARFGDAGCWMTQNLRSKKAPSKTLVLTTDYRVPGGNEPTAIAGNYGLHYTWAAAVDFSSTGFETVASGAAGKQKSTFRGICPEGWVLPSDYDWNMLEKEIATYPSEYSTHTTPIAWDVAWESVNGNWRPASGGANNWGQNMLSVTQVNNQATVGKSNASNNRGFDALLVGTNGSISTYTYFWSSSAYSATTAWNRTLGSSLTGTSRTGYSRFYLFSVRCKKKD